MKYLDIPSFTGIDKSTHPRNLQNDKLYDARNVYFEDGRVYTRPGYDTYGTNVPLSGAMLCLNQFKKLRTQESTLIAITENSFYEYDPDTELWTEHVVGSYNTGTVIPPSEITFNNAATTYVSMAKISDTQFVITFRDEGDSNKGKAITGTIADGVVTFGSEFIFNNAATTYNSVCFLGLDVTEAFAYIVVAFTDVGGDSYGTAVMGTITLADGSIAFNSEFVFKAAETEYISITTLDSTHVAIAYESSARIGTVTLATGAIAFGTAVVFTAASSAYIDIAALDSTHIAIVYRKEEGEFNWGKAIIGTVTLATGVIVFGSEYQFEEESARNSITVLDSTHIAIVYTSVGTAIIGTVTLATGAIAFGTGYEFTGNISYVSIAALDSTHIAIVYRDFSTTVGKAITGTVTLATRAIVFGSEYTFNAASTNYPVISALDENKIMIAFSDDGDSDKGKAMYYDRFGFTGSGTTFDTGWPDGIYDIKFGTDSLTGTGTPDIWYKINTPESATYLTLANEDLLDYLENDFYLLTASTDYIIRYSIYADSDDFFSTANIIEGLGGGDEKQLVLTNYKNDVLLYDGSTLAELDFTGDGGVAPLSLAKFAAYYHGCIVLAYCYDTANMPQSVYWSARGYPTYWATLGASYADLIQGDDYITGMEVYKERLYIFKERSIAECYYTGTVNPMFEFTEDKVKGIGQPYGRTIVNTGEILLFKGEDNIYAFNGFQAAPIGKQIIQHLKDNESLDYRDKAFAAHISKKYLYCLFVVSTEATEPDLCYIVNYITGSSTIWNFHDNFRVTGLYSDSDYIMFGDALGYVYMVSLVTATDVTDNGNSITAYIETKDYPLNDYRHFVRLLETVLVAQTNTGSIQISCSTDFGGTWSTPIVIDQDTSEDIYDHIQNWMQKGKQMRFKIENVSGSKFGLESFMIGYDDAGI